MQKLYSLKFVLTLMVVASALTAMLFALILSFFGGNIFRDVDSRTQYFDALIDVIDDRFIGDADIDELLISAKRATVEALDDEWSFYLTAEEYERRLESMRNQFVGIGVEVIIEEDSGDIRILNVHRNSGAYEAGILVGDIIVSVDGESTVGLALDELREALRRPIDDTAIVGVIRESFDDILEKVVVYRVVFMDPVSYMMLDGNIGYVSLRNFDTGARYGFINAVEYLIERGAVAFIYDVRSNPGGQLAEMTGILDFLLPEGVIFISVSTDGGENRIYSDESFLDMPTAVLVNSNSHSAAEYFAALLREYDYAYTIGEQTTGKNRLQTTIALPCGGAVHLSTGEYLTKNRVSLREVGGFTPEFIVEMSEDDYLMLRRGELDIHDDVQLQMALSLLTN